MIDHDSFPLTILFNRFFQQQLIPILHFDNIVHIFKAFSTYSEGQFHFFIPITKRTTICKIQIQAIHLFEYSISMKI